MKAKVLNPNMTAFWLANSLFLLLLMSAAAMALEEPSYQVIEQHDEFELRRYDPYIVAEVDVPGDSDSADGYAFRILAGYIFGDNQAAEKMEMTAPVESRPAAASVKMEMTAPVTSAPADKQGMTTYAFVMERKYSLETLPRPNNDRVRLRTVPAKTVAVRRYAGRWTDKNYAEHTESLRTALAAQGIETVGEPTLARYNSPFSLPIMRRNEIMLEIVSKAARNTPD